MMRSVFFITLCRLFLAALPCAAASPRFNALPSPPPIGADSVRADSGSSLVADSLLWPHSATARLDRLMNDPLLATTQVGLAVFDLTADTMLYERGANQVMRPASCQKLLTAVTALSVLGASHRFVTSLYLHGTVADSTLHGDLYVVGGFDPAFGRDDMHAFAFALTGLGIWRIDGRIVADVSMKDTLRWGKGWCWDDDLERLTPLMYQRRDVFMEQFYAALAEAGISAPAVWTTGRRPATGTRLVVQRYHAMDQILGPMMKRSDNIYAEAMFYQLGARGGHPYAGSEASAQAVEQLIASWGESRAHFRVADGSGLSLYNYTTPRILIKALRYAYSQSPIYLHLYPSLPIAGIDGTLRSRMTGGTAYGNVRAKTGTVEGVSSLAGYLTTAGGHLLAFAMINQGVLSTRVAQRWQDRVCRALTAP